MNQDELRVEIHKAAHYGDLEGMRKCLAAGVNVNDYQGITPLHRAAGEGLEDNLKVQSHWKYGRLRLQR